MVPDRDWNVNRLLQCDECSATFSVEDALLIVEGCNRIGKGTVGTNQMVRNDARKRLAERQLAEMQAHRAGALADEAASWGVTADMPADELQALVLSDPYVFTQELALKALWLRGDTVQLKVIAASGSKYASVAQMGLDSPCGGNSTPYFFDEKFNPLPL